MKRLHRKARLRAQLHECVGSEFSQVGAGGWGRWLLWAEEQGAEHSPAGAHSGTDLHPWRSKQEHSGFLLRTMIVFVFAFPRSIILHFRLCHPPQQGLWQWQFSRVPLSTSYVLVLRSPSSSVAACGQCWGHHAQHGGEHTSPPVAMVQVSHAVCDARQAHGVTLLHPAGISSQNLSDLASKLSCPGYGCLRVWTTAVSNLYAGVLCDLTLRVQDSSQHQ